MADFSVQVTGLNNLRRDLRALDRELGKDLTKVLKEGAETVIPAARALAPKRTGALAASLRPGAAGTKAYIRSRLPYANVIHWGGSVGRRKRTFVRANRFIERAAISREGATTDAIADGIDRLVRQHGWE